MFLPVSEAVARALRARRAATLHEVVPNFIGELPPPPPADDPRLAALPAEPFILYFGDVAEDKGVGNLVEAYRELEEPPPLVLIGRQLLEGVGEVPGVVALDPMPHPLAIEALRRSLFSVAPSLLPESFGIVALEAAAAGKPAVVSDIGGLSDIVVDGETGFLVAPGDREGAARRLRAALRRRGAAASGWGRRRGERAKLFSADAIVPRVRGCIRACRAGSAQGRRPSPPIGDGAPARGVRRRRRTYPRPGNDAAADRHQTDRTRPTEPTPPPETIRLQPTSGFGRVLAPRSSGASATSPSRSPPATSPSATARPPSAPPGRSCSRSPSWRSSP